MDCKKILVLGASGFIGQHVMEKLGNGKGFDVLGVNTGLWDMINQAHPTYGDFTPDCVIMCAGTYKNHNKNNVREMYANVSMLMHVLNVFENSKIVYIGSGASGDGNEYSRSCDICRSIVDRFDNVINLNLYGAYGKYETNVNRFIPKVIKQCMLGNVELEHDVFIDYIGADDLANIIEYIITHDMDNKSYDIGGFSPVRSSSIIKLVANSMDVKVNIND